MLNRQYNNIFRFDFSDPQTVPDSSAKFGIKGESEADSNQIDKNALKYDLLQEAKKHLTKKEYGQIVLEILKSDLIDSINTLNNRKTVDTVYRALTMDPELIDSLHELEASIHKMLKELDDKKNTVEEMHGQLTPKRDSLYNDWIKSTVKLYESMDAQQVAKLLQNFSDNEARDILYTMKRKKAAQVMSYLSTEAALKLTRSQQ